MPDDFTILNVTGEYDDPVVMTFTFPRRKGKVIARTPGFKLGGAPFRGRGDDLGGPLDDVGRPLELVPEGSTVDCRRCFKPTSYAAGCCYHCGALN